jgi:uncharacterized protein YegP (UPF0339 family)
MLLDELQAVDNEIDFYEEDEIDKLARQNGKWIICRIITKDNVAPEEETFFFELHASNGDKLLASEECPTYNAALRALQTHKNNILHGNFRITISKIGEYVFKLCNGKKLLLCKSDSFESRELCEHAIELVKKFAKTAVVDENIQDFIVKLPQESERDLPLLTDTNGKWVIRTKLDINWDTVYYFELLASNGERLLTSEEYTTYIGAFNGIQTFKTNIADDNFHITLTKQGDYVYKLLNKNGQLLCLSEHYRTKKKCAYAVEEIKLFAKRSPILTVSSIKE